MEGGGVGLIHEGLSLDLLVTLGLSFMFRHEDSGSLKTSRAW